jgi:hypothetical protein
MTGSPSIVPETSERDIYLALDDFGSLLGQAWREAGEDDTERLTLVANLLDGQYHNPTRIIAFNTAEGWSRDVSEDVADELAARCAERDEVPTSLQHFLERYKGTHRPSQLRLRL